MKTYIKMVMFLVILSAVSAGVLTAFNVNIKERIDQNKKQERLLHILKSMDILPADVDKAVAKDLEEFTKSDDYKQAKNGEFAKAARTRELVELHLKEQTMDQLKKVFEEKLSVLEVDKKSPDKVNFYTGKEFVELPSEKIDYIHKVYIFKGDCRGNHVYSFEVAGAAFWDKVSGYLTLREGFEEIGGLSFYDNKETPGLGKRIEEGWFQAQFTHWNKKIFNEAKSIHPQLRVTAVTGKYDGDAGHKAVNEVEAITGASETSRALDRFLTANLRDFFKMVHNTGKNNKEVRAFFGKSYERVEVWHNKASKK